MPVCVPASPSVPSPAVCRLWQSTSLPVATTILLCFLVLGWLYIRETPLLETPDEPSHFSLVKYIADNGRLPPQPLSPAVFQPVPKIAEGPPAYYAPPLYYLIGSQLITGLNTSGFAQAVVPNPSWERGWAPIPGRDAFNKNAYVHLASQPPYDDWALAIYRLRFFSLFLGVATVMGVYWLGRRLWPGSGGRCWSWTATILVAFNPAYIFLTAGVTNDALLVALATWSFALMAWLLTARRSARLTRWPALLLAFILGLALLTKQSAFILLPIAAITVCWKGRRERWPWQRVMGWLLLGGFIVALLGGWWYLHNGLAYGDPLGLRPHRTFPPDEPVIDRLLLLGQQMWAAFQSYWAAFGWALIFVHPAWYTVAGILTFGGLAGWLVHWRRGSGAIFWLLSAAVVLNGSFLLLWMWRIPAPYGRLLFPTIAPLACLVVEGWRRSFARLGDWEIGRLRGANSLTAIWQGGVVTLLVVSSALAPFLYLRPAFKSPLAPVTALTTTQPILADFGPGFQLVGYRLDPEIARPGETVRLTLYWQRSDASESEREPVQSNMMVFVQLAPQDATERVASVDEFLGTSRYPTSFWRPGELIEQEHWLQIGPQTAVPSLYWFTIGLYEEEPQERLPLQVDGRPAPDNALRLGPMRLVPGGRPAQQPEYITHYDFAAVIRLAGHDLVISESELKVRLYWLALKTPPLDWTVFVHLLDASGQLVSQHDGRPRAGNYPTSWWRPDDWIIDEHSLPLPAEATLTGYQLKVGLYTWPDGQRAPVTNREGKLLPNQEVVLNVR